MVFSLKSMCIPCFVSIIVSYMVVHVPIVMYGLRLFIVVLQELHCLPNCLHICISEFEVAITSPSFVALLLFSEIAKCIA